MKRQYFVMMLLAMLWAVNATAAALVTKERKITDQFVTDSYSKLRITNQYGKVHINTWNKNEVTVTILITAKATTETKAEKLLKDVDISQQKNDNRFSYYTSVKRNNLTLNNNTQLEIDYTVNMPYTMYLELNNRFGDVFIDDFGGHLHLAVGYGTVKAQKLTGSNINLQVEFGGLSVISVETAKVETRYSKLTIDKAGDLVVSNRFGKAYISNVKKLTLAQDYGEAKLDNIEVLKGNISYSGFNINKIGKEATLNMQYCSKCSLGTISGNTEKLSVHAKFSKLVCNVESSADLSVVIATKFGSVHGLSLQKAEMDEDRYSASYRGKIGTGSGKMAMSLEYTDVSFK